MGALRKQKDRPEGRHGRPLPPEAFQYDDDVTEETVKSIQQEADKIIREEEWIVIDGYVGRK